MNLSFAENMSVLTVFLQGLLSFFSPCVLPLLPLYIGYLSGGAQTAEEDGTIRYQRGKVVTNTFFFVLGISATFFLLGLGATAVGSFLSSQKVLLTRVGGVIVLVFGLFQLGVFRSFTLSRERRISLHLDQLAMNPLTAFVLGFTFSFSWTPCVGPALASVLLMASSAASRSEGILLIGVYTLGFVLPFLAVGWFTSSLLQFFKQHQNVVRFTAKAGGVLLIAVGILMLSGFFGDISGQEIIGESSQTSSSASQDSQEDSQEQAMQAPDFLLTDQYGESHYLSDYKGKTVVLNFWATWCPYCVDEMPYLQNLYEEYGFNQEDLVILGVANPKSDSVTFANDISQPEVEAFLEEEGYTYPVLMDLYGEVFSLYGVTSLPTTWFIDRDGNLFGVVGGGMTESMLQSAVEQTMESGETSSSQ